MSLCLMPGCLSIRLMRMGSHSEKLGLLGLWSTWRILGLFLCLSRKGLILRTCLLRMRLLRFSQLNLPMLLRVILCHRKNMHHRENNSRDYNWISLNTRLFGSYKLGRKQKKLGHVLFSNKNKQISGLHLQNNKGNLICRNRNNSRKSKLI